MLATQEPVAAPATGVGSTRRSAPARGSARLVSAFADVESFPALSRSRDAMLAALDDETAGRNTLTGVVEADPALLIAVLRAAGQTAPRRRP